MTDDVTYGAGTPQDPWVLQTPSRTSGYTAWREETAEPPALVVRVGSTTLSYHLAAVDDLAAMLKMPGLPENITTQARQRRERIRRRLGNVDASE